MSALGFFHSVGKRCFYCYIWADFCPHLSKGDDEDQDISGSDLLYRFLQQTFSASLKVQIQVHVQFICIATFTIKSVSKGALQR